MNLKEKEDPIQSAIFSEPARTKLAQSIIAAIRNCLFHPTCGNPNHKGFGHPIKDCGDPECIVGVILEE